MDDGHKAIIWAASIIGLSIFAAGSMIEADRYQIAAAGGAMYRLDKSSGEVTVCLPVQGCVPLARNAE